MELQKRKGQEYREKLYSYLGEEILCVCGKHIKRSSLAYHKGTHKHQEKVKQLEPIKDLFESEVKIYEELIGEYTDYVKTLKECLKDFKN